MSEERTVERTGVPVEAGPAPSPSRSTRRRFIVRGALATAGAIGATTYLKPELRGLGIPSASAAGSPNPPPPPLQPPPPQRELKNIAALGLPSRYWKTNTNVWQGYTTTQTLGSVFTIPASLSSFGGVKLLDALDEGRGPGVAGAARVLFRAAVAALLNAASSFVDYPLTTAQVIGQVNAALVSNSNNRRATIEALATDLEKRNNA